MRPVLRHSSSVLHHLTGSRPIPLWFWRQLRRLGKRPDSLVPRSQTTAGTELPDEVLANALSDSTLGTWTIGPATINYLGRVVAERAPTVILEFGSGVSTVCLAHFAALHSPETRIVTVEQSAKQAAITRQKLAELSAKATTRILVAPLVDAVVAGRALSAYDLDTDELDRALSGQLIDMVVIDGPAAEEGARFGTLPLVHSRLSAGALVILDDALRDGELEAAQAWKRMGYLELDGLIPIEHGILVGRARMGDPNHSAVE